MFTINKRIILIAMLWILASSCFSETAGNDPTRPPDFIEGDTAVTPEQELTVSMILIDSKRKIAIINNQLAREGDSLDGITVESITSRGVTISRKGRLIELPLIKQRDTGSVEKRQKPQD